MRSETQPYSTVIATVATALMIIRGIMYKQPERKLIGMK